MTELKAELKKRDLSTSGVKVELIARLTEAEEIDQNETKLDAPVPDESVEADNPPDSLPSTSPQREQPVQNEASPVAKSQDHLESDIPINGGSKPENHLPGTADLQTAPLSEVKAKAAVDEAEKNENNVSKTIPDDGQEISRDTQKRKRRSASPPPSVHDTKRTKTETDGTIAGTGDSNAAVATDSLEDNSMRTDNEIADVSMTDILPETNGPEEANRSVAPSLHCPTPALYIRNLMRPLHLEDLRDHLIELATLPGAEPDRNVLTDCFLDHVRTHAFASFSSTAAADRVRCLLHEAVFPDESNRKALWVDFIPEDRVQEWIDEEERQPRGSGVRFEVTYETTSAGTQAKLVELGLNSGARGRQPPTGPRIHPGVEGAPSAPRADQRRTHLSRNPRFNDPNIRTTRAEPMLYWKPLSDDLAERRIEDMRRYYSPDARISDDNRRNDINRYYFENGDNFVDRGKEIFAGIRPPHREREHRRLMREQRQQGGSSRLLEPSRRDRNRIPAPQSFRPIIGDRYISGASRSNSWRDGDSYLSRYEDRRPDRASDRRPNRASDRRPNRASDRRPDRVTDRGGGGGYRDYRGRSGRR